MLLTGSGNQPERVRAAIAVAALHALLAYAFIVGLAVEVARKAAGELKLITISEKPVPPPEPAATPAKDEAAEGAASPVSMAARPTPVVAPPPKIRIPKPPPLPTVPKAIPVPAGRDASAGSSDRPGPGTGAGGDGPGTGSGGLGTGTGGGGAARAQRISGALANSDYPRSALRAGAEGTVSVRYTVGADGRVSGCAVTRSSGHPELDSTTCRLIERRFVYRPARDSTGKPAAEVVRKTYDWILPAKRGLGQPSLD